MAGSEARTGKWRCGGTTHAPPTHHPRTTRAALKQRHHDCKVFASVSAGQGDHQVIGSAPPAPTHARQGSKTALQLDKDRRRVIQTKRIAHRGPWSLCASAIACQSRRS
jgi:hypothetical protein